ncbi:hypothetical protein WJ13_32145 [Burkholderia seminalis]|nr:hypothetical protein WJ13_32145 [Burkholderia seminalis]
MTGCLKLIPERPFSAIARIHLNPYYTKIVAGNLQLAALERAQLISPWSADEIAEFKYHILSCAGLGFHVQE